MKKKSVYMILGVIAIILIFALVIAICGNDSLDSSKKNIEVSEPILTDIAVKTSVGDSERDNVENQSDNIEVDTTDLKKDSSTGKSEDVNETSDNEISSKNSEKNTKKKKSKVT